MNKMTVKHDVIGQLTQSDVPSFHPNRTIGLATAPVVTSTDVMNNLRSLGLAAPSDIPERFDWRKLVKLSPVMNQGHCGNCWAMAATSSFTDRWIIAKGKDGLVLDPLPITVCVKGNKCGGGLPENCQEYFETFGASEASAGCVSWSEFCSAKDEKECCKNCKTTVKGQIPNIEDHNNPQNHPTINCEDLKCKGGFKAKPGMMKAGTVMAGNKIDNTATIHSIKTDIKLHGPVSTKYRVFGDFMVADGGLVVNSDDGKGKTFQWQKTNGIYINGQYDEEVSHAFKQLAHNTQAGDARKLQILSTGLMPTENDEGILVGSVPSETPIGFHAVEIVGWDVDDKWGEYWIVKNSWGDKWNKDGYFKFGMNTDGKTNSKCGMDIPLVVGGIGNEGNPQLLGGTISFLPDLSAPHPKWEGSQVGTSLGSTISGIKWWVWVLFGIILILFIYLLFFHFRHTSPAYKSKYPPLHELPRKYPYMVPVRPEPAAHTVPFNPRAYSPGIY